MGLFTLPENYGKPNIFGMTDYGWDNNAVDEEGEMLSQMCCNVLDSMSIGCFNGEYSLGATTFSNVFNCDVETGIKASKKLSHIQKTIDMVSGHKPCSVSIDGGLKIDIPLNERRTVGLDYCVRRKIAEGMTLPCCIGIDSEVNPFYIDLAKAPHLLIAGASGSGKSVCLNDILLSLMYHTSFKDVKFIMIDPKKVELSAYRKSPYLYKPIVTDSNKAVSTLKDVYNEMEYRYGKMKRKRVNTLDDAPGLFPRLVVAIDEFANLMYGSHKKECEELVSQICAKGRACGIHMIVATQTPKAEVITGKIKANMPSRLAFSVASINDSKVILDYGGAEKLVGMGDGLYMSPTTTQRTRFQSAYVSGEDIKKMLK